MISIPLPTLLSAVNVALKTPTSAPRVEGIDAETFRGLYSRALTENNQLLADACKRFAVGDPTLSNLDLRTKTLETIRQGLTRWAAEAPRTLSPSCGKLSPDASYPNLWKELPGKLRLALLSGQEPARIASLEGDPQLHGSYLSDHFLSLTLLSFSPTLHADASASLQSAISLAQAVEERLDPRTREAFWTTLLLTPEFEAWRGRFNPSRKQQRTAGAADANRASELPGLQEKLYDLLLAGILRRLADPLPDRPSPAGLHRIEAGELPLWHRHFSAHTRGLLSQEVSRAGLLPAKILMLHSRHGEILAKVLDKQMVILPLSQPERASGAARAGFALELGVASEILLFVGRGVGLRRPEASLIRGFWDELRGHRRHKFGAALVALSRLIGER